MRGADVMAYLLDADVFIRAKNLHYGFDFCPAFWEWLVAAGADGRAVSIERVGDELAAGDDDLAKWAAERGADFFLRPTPDVLSALGAVSRWITRQQYEPAAVSTFLQVADTTCRACPSHTGTTSSRTRLHRPRHAESRFLTSASVSASNA